MQKKNLIQDLYGSIMQKVQSEQQRERQVKKKKNETSIQNLWDQKCALKNYGWKIPKAKEGNVYSGTGSTECPK